MAGTVRTIRRLAKLVGRHERRYRVNGALYVIRDLYKGRQFIACEYAQRNPNGSTRWLPCAEGVEFAAIQPLRVRPHG